MAEHACRRTTLPFAATASRALAFSMATRAKPEILFLDCDDCLYQNGWATAGKITKSIAAYTEGLGVSGEKAYSLYKEHGTCLKGMLAEGIMEAAGAEDFLVRAQWLRTVLLAPCWLRPQLWPLALCSSRSTTLTTPTSPRIRSSPRSSPA